MKRIMTAMIDALSGGIWFIRDLTDVLTWLAIESLETMRSRIENRDKSLR